MGNWFWRYFRQIFISLAFRKCKKDCNILRIFLVEGFCPLKVETARFPIAFHLNMLYLQCPQLINKFNSLNKVMILFYLYIPPYKMSSGSVPKMCTKKVECKQKQQSRLKQVLQCWPEYNSQEISIGRRRLTSS